MTFFGGLFRANNKREKPAWRRARSREKRWPPHVECLEDRTLPSTIKWVETGFDAAYGPNAAAARAVVARAVSDWSRVIQNFNYQNVGGPCNAAGFCPASEVNTFTMGFTARDLGAGKRGEAWNITNYDPDGKPTTAGITLDDDGGGNGWYFDNNNDNAEFTNLVTRYRANFTGVGGQADDSDFYRTVLHEMGHALGLGATPPTFAAIQKYMTSRGVDQTPNGTGGIDGSQLWLFSRSGVTATFTSNGGGHLYEGPADPLYPSDPIHPNDLMNPGRTESPPPTGRSLISDLDAIILGLGYGYTVNLPSTQQTFLAVNNSEARALTINGDPETVNNVITLRTVRVLGQTLLTVDVNGIQSTWLRSQLSGGIVVQSGNGADTINVESGPDGVPVTIYGGDGGDTISVTNPNGALTILGNAGIDRITVRSTRADVGILINGGTEADIIRGDTVAGPLTIIGGDGTDQIDVASSSTGRSVVDGSGGDDTITILAAAGPFTVSGGAGADTINVERLYRGAPVAIDGGTELDRFNLSPVLHNLSNIQGPVSIDGGTLLGDDYLAIDDSGNFSANRTITVTASGVELPAGNVITYTRVGTVDLRAGPASDATVNVHSTVGGALTIINGAGIVNVGGPSPNPLIAGTFTDGIHGSLRIRNLVGQTTALTIDDTGSSGTQRAVVVTANSVGGFTEQPILFGGARLSSLTVNAGPAGNSFVVQDTGLPSAASSITLNTGLGADTVRIERINASVTVNGQRGRDTVHVGLDGSLEGINASLTVTNFGAWSAVVLDDTADTTRDDVTMQSAGLYTVITDLAPAAIRLRGRDLSALDIKAGSGNNVFTIRDTPQSTIPGGAEVTLHAGINHDVVNVVGTSGRIVVDGQTGLNQISIGLSPTGLNRLNGAVTVRGPGGLNYLTVNDSASTTGDTFILDTGVVQRTDKAAIFYEDLSSLDVIAGAAANPITVRNTSAALVTHLSTGGGSDLLTVERTTGSLSVVAGEQTHIDVGTATSSLDNIQGRIAIFPSSNNLTTLRLIDTATTTRRSLLASGSSLGQSYQRAPEGSTEWLPLVDVLFEPIPYFTYLGGSGGSDAYVVSTAAGTSSEFAGHAGARDAFFVGWATDMNNVLGGVTCAGQPADGDFAHCYDYLNPNPQTYTALTSPFTGALGVLRPGTSGVQFSGLSVSLFGPAVGGSIFDVQSVPATISLSILAHDNDTVNVGSDPDNPLLSTLDGIQGPVTIVDGGTRNFTDMTTLNIYDQGNARAGQRYTLNATTLDRTGAATITYGDARYDTINLHAGSGGNVITVDDTAGIYTFTNIFSGTGNDLVNVLANGYAGFVTVTNDGGADLFRLGSISQGAADTARHGGTLANLQDGLFQFVLRQGSATLVIDDSGDTRGPRTADLVPNALFGSSLPGGLTPASIVWSVSNVVLHGSDAGNTFNLANNGVWVPLEICGGSNADTFNVSGLQTLPYWSHSFTFHGEGGLDALTVNDQPATDSPTWSVTGPSLTRTSRQPELPWDSVVRLDHDGLESVALRAGGGTDTLDYSAYPSGVKVNLLLGTASGVTGGVSGIENVIGSAGNDILVGSGGNVLTGGGGRDLLIAGALASELFGGDDEDLLIGGTTIYDEDQAGLDAILAEWASPANYETRVTNLRNGLLGLDVVTANGKQNELHGQAGRDFFFASPLDLNDGEANEAFA